MDRSRRLTLAFDDPDLQGRIARMLAAPLRPETAAWEEPGLRPATHDPDSGTVRPVARPDILITDRPSANDARAVLGIGSRATGTIWLPADASPAQLHAAVGHLCQWLDRLDELEQWRSERQQLIERARLDPLTSLANRQAWNETLAQCVRDSQATCQSLIVALVDLDGFKQVNEQLGLNQGDRWLVRAAQSLRAKLSEPGNEGTLAARWGGDEFAVLRWSLLDQSPQQWVDDLRTAMSASEPTRRDKPGEPIRTTASAGWANSEHSTVLSAEVLFAQAEQALRAAKRAGGDRTMGTLPAE